MTARAPARPDADPTVADGFLDVAADPVSAAIVLADAFADGARLSIVALDAPDHAHHVAVEFVHPVVAGLPALPAVVASGGHGAGDVVLTLGPAPMAGYPRVLSIPPELGDAEVMSYYHLLWELVHVTLDHRAPDASAGDSTGFLYPFLDDAGPDPNRAEAGLRAALVSAAELQRADSSRARAAALVRNADAVDAAAHVIASTVRAGGQVYALGNGGSATDAARLARLFAGIGVPCTSLADDYAVVTALANDLGADRIFARQIDAFVRPGDVVCGWSTSGTSANLVAAFERAAALGARCIGSCGYGGEALTGLGTVEVSLTVDEQSIHRIQEAQADLMAALVATVEDQVGRGAT